ncbi:hypothetical protein Tco_0793202 [Tanacetum coccineum]
MEEDPEEEPEEAPVMGFDMGMDWENVDDEEPELIFPYEAKGPPYPPPPASPDAEPEMDIAGFRAMRVAQEMARVENIRLRRELEEMKIKYTLMSMAKEREEIELYRLGALPYHWYEMTFQYRDDKEGPSDAIDVSFINLHPSKLNMSGPQDEIPPLPPPPPSSSQTPTQPTPHTVSTIKLPILKKGEYDIWAMKMEHYLAHTDYPIWEVIQNGNGPVSITTDTSGQIKVLPPRTAKEIVAKERERKAMNHLLTGPTIDHLC